MSRKQKGSNNRYKARLKVAKLHEKITNQRKDFLHKLSTKLIRENQSIAIEDLKVKNMLENNIGNERRTSIQVAELEVKDGVLVCDRNKDISVKLK